MNKLYTIYLLLFVFLYILLLPEAALAHVGVKPAEAGISAFQTFTVGVPVEKEIGTTQIRLLIPKGLAYVTPNVKTGWAIETIKDGENISEIIWSGGYIPAGQRDEFTFSAQVPNKETSVNWKAYQTYEDGTIVSWDREPKEVSHDDEGADNTGPYSTTKIVNDLDTHDNMVSPIPNPADRPNRLSIFLSSVAIILSAVSLLLHWNKKDKKKK